MLLRKPAITIILGIAVLVFGFIFLLKGCLAKYDERFIKVPALYFEKDGKAVVFSIVEFQKTTSYSRKGNMTQKSVSTSYYVQTNDGATTAFIANKKIKGHRQVKNFPIEILGASGTTAWLFMGEPMAFDAFTLEKKADIAILEAANGQLQGKFPAERQFYDFNRMDNNVYFTATDGSKWKLDTRTLKATPSAYQKNESQFDQKLAAIEKELKTIEVNMDSLYQQKYFRPSNDYAHQKISRQEYQQLQTEYYKEREQASELTDSLRKIKNEWENNKRQLEDLERSIEQLQRANPGFSQIRINQDTIASGWYGLYSEEELDKLNERVSDQRAYDETVRRKLVTGNYSVSKNNDAVINKATLQSSGTADFLAAGFLLDKKTAQPIRLKGDQSFIIVHKDKVGKDGTIQVTLLSKEGKVIWNYNTLLTDWADWIFTGNRLIVFGVNNKNLSSNECNVLLSINLDNGTAAQFDYFKNK